MRRLGASVFCLKSVSFEQHNPAPIPAFPQIKERDLGEGGSAVFMKTLISTRRCAFPPPNMTCKFSVNIGIL
jgi:hypothetical protein